MSASPAPAPPSADAPTDAAVDAPKDVPKNANELARLRAELDRLDDVLHDALMARAAVVARVGRSGAKGAVKLRLGRQAAILRRLLARHAGPFPPAGVLRLWLELLAGSTAMQGPFAVAVAGEGLAPVAREQFGALTPLHPHPDALVALAAVRAGAATVAVLPLPEGAGGDWWPSLLPGHGEARLHVVARLPLWAPRPEGAPEPPALVVAAVSPDPSGEDHTLLALRASASDGAVAALRAAGLDPLDVPRPHAAGLVLVTLPGFVAEEDPRLAALPRDAAPAVLGAHAVPMAPSEAGQAASPRPSPGASSPHTPRSSQEPAP